MLPKTKSAAAAAVLALLALGFASNGQESAPPQSPSPSLAVRTFFSIRSAALDETVGEEVREDFEVDDGSPLKSVSIDLNGDGRLEKFVLNSVLSGSGGSQWLVTDTSRGISRGLVVGSIIFVLDRNDEGYPRLETYWKQSVTMAVVFEYTYSRGRYVRTNSRALTVPEIAEYFRQKPPLDLDRELVEIRISTPYENIRPARRLF
jgi:hypothetical protein